jgi:hypothetical protein
VAEEEEEEEEETEAAADAEEGLRSASRSLKYLS